MNYPIIETQERPPDRHAQRVVGEMLKWLHAEHWRQHQQTLGIINVRKMGTVEAQRRTADRLRKAMNILALDVQISPAKRGRFLMSVIEWAVWDLTKDDMVTGEQPIPINAWLAVSLTFITGANHRPVMKCTVPLLVTRHACERLATRAGVRTPVDLIVALRELWEVAYTVIRDENAWHNDEWKIPMERGAIAVLVPDAKSGGKRFVVTTILEPGWV
jgi:hypothetical protein